MNSILDFLSRRSYEELLGLWIALASLIVVLLAAIVRLVLRCVGRRPRTYWKVVGWGVLALAPVHAFVLVPFGMAQWATTWAHTRDDESFYAGPHIDADGTWQPQHRRSWEPGTETLEPVPAETDPVSPYEVWFSAADGVSLRGFFVPSVAAPRFTAVLTHGLWRGALEIEPVGAMFRELGGDVLLLELRNHGKSQHRRFTAGLTESQDVLAAVEYVRAHGRAANVPLVLYGVSLGSAATALAAPRVEHLSGLVLDAPLDSVGAVADRMIAGAGGGRRARRFFPEWAWPIQKLALGITMGENLDKISPIAALSALDPAVHVLVIGGDQDARCPPDAVKSVFAALRASPTDKTLWIQAGSDHGKVWRDEPAAYLAHLAALIDAIAPPAAQRP